MDATFEPVHSPVRIPASEIVAAVNTALDAAPSWPGALTFTLRKLVAEHPEWNADDVWAAVEQRQAARREARRAAATGAPLATLARTLTTDPERGER